MLHFTSSQALQAWSNGSMTASRIRDSNCVIATLPSYQCAGPLQVGVTSIREYEEEIIRARDEAARREADYTKQVRAGVAEPNQNPAGTPSIEQSIPPLQRHVRFSPVCHGAPALLFAWGRVLLQDGAAHKGMTLEHIQCKPLPVSSQPWPITVHVFGARHAGKLWRAPLQCLGLNTAFSRVSAEDAARLARDLYVKSAAEAKKDRLLA